MKKRIPEKKPEMLECIVEGKKESFEQIQDKNTFKISRTIATLSNEEVGLNFFGKYTTGNGANKDMKINNSQNNNEEHVPEISPESSGSSQHGAKLEKVIHETVSDYEKPEAALIRKMNVWLETVNAVATNQEEVMVNMEDVIEIHQTWNRIYMMNSLWITLFQKMDTIENEAEFTTVINKKKNNKNKSKPIQEKIRASPYKKLHQEDEALCFIKKKYRKIYKKEEIDLEPANSITRNLPMVSESENLALMRAIKQNEDVAKQHWMMFVDQQKAFDRIDHNFLQILEI
ncbi:20280_t:CDS:2 [Gigaspora rosea]|nr:20280_t:CDS:2 [Gigaspora rosea]